MISNKVFERLERLCAQETLGAPRCPIDTMDRGAVAIDGKGLIWHANHSTDCALNREVQGLPLTTETTGDSLYDGEEAWLTLEGQEHHALRKQILLSSQDNDRLTMITLRDAHDYPSNPTLFPYESDMQV